MVVTDIHSTWLVFRQACKTRFELSAMLQITLNCSSSSTEGMVLIMAPTMTTIFLRTFYQPCRWGSCMESVSVRLQSELCESWLLQK